MFFFFLKCIILHNYIDEPSAKIKAHQRYREFEMTGSFIFLHINQGEKKSRKISEQKNCRSQYFYVIGKDISFRVEG